MLKTASFSRRCWGRGCARQLFILLVLLCRGSTDTVDGDESQAPRGPWPGRGLPMGQGGRRANRTDADGPERGDCGGSDNREMSPRKLKYAKRRERGARGVRWGTEFASKHQSADWMSVTAQGLAGHGACWLFVEASPTLGAKLRLADSTSRCGAMARVIGWLGQIPNSWARRMVDF